MKEKTPVSGQTASPVPVQERQRPSAEYLATLDNGMVVGFRICGKCHADGIYCKCQDGPIPPAYLGEVVSVETRVLEGATS